MCSTESIVHSYRVTGLISLSLFLASDGNRSHNNTVNEGALRKQCTFNCSPFARVPVFSELLSNMHCPTSLSHLTSRHYLVIFSYLLNLHHPHRLPFLLPPLLAQAAPVALPPGPFPPQPSGQESRSSEIRANS